ncbi:MAG: hypothetical protein HYV09_35295 [Deltaproteobacteria bacterium]|nr:hypothetical protein [Deltaproteobacteria bacterium]
MRLFVGLLVVAAVGSSGCKLLEKKVPDDIVKKAVSGSLRHMPNTATAMCGGDTKGLMSATVTVKSRGEKSTGVAHVVGKPWPGKDLPSSCEGDVEFAFSYSTKTYGSGKRRRTETTWFLDKLKLVAVQTEGVKLASQSEESNDPDKDDDGDDDDDSSKTKTKKKKSSDDE